jgi:hypothetical protein
MADNLVAGFGEDASSAAIGDEIGAALDGLDQAFEEHGAAGAIAYYETLAATDPPESAVTRLSERLGALISDPFAGGEAYLDTMNIEGLDENAFLEYFGMTPEGMDQAKLSESMYETAWMVVGAYGGELVTAAQNHDDAALQDVLWQMASDPLVNAAIENSPYTAEEVIGFIMAELETSYMEAGYDTFATIAEAMESDLMTALDANSPAELFVPAGEAITGGVILGIENKLSALGEQMAAVAQAALDAVNKAFGIESPAKQFVPVGKAIIDGIILGVNARITAMVEAIKAAAQAAIDAANEQLGIASPSRAFMTIGEQMSAGLIEGLAGGSPAVEAALMSLLEPTLPPMPGPGGWGSTDNSSHTTTTNNWNFSPQYAEGQREEDVYQDFIFMQMAAGVKRR